MEKDCFKVDPSAYRYARHKSRQLAGKYGFLHADAVDIEHELLLDCLNRSRAWCGISSSLRWLPDSLTSTGRQSPASPFAMRDSEEETHRARFTAGCT